jgi:hypothetical protein
MPVLANDGFPAGRHYLAVSAWVLALLSIHHIPLFMQKSIMQGATIWRTTVPFQETNQPVRRLLDKIVAQSTGAAWIALIPPGTAGISLLAESHGAWALVEYHGPSMDFTGTVNALATQLQ